MLAPSRLETDCFNRLKCGEICFDTPSVFYVTCSLCENEMQLEDFTFHFLNKHLATHEESITLELLGEECKTHAENYDKSVEFISNSEDRIVYEFDEEDVNSEEYVFEEDCDENGYDSDRCLEISILQENTDPQKVAKESMNKFVDISRLDLTENTKSKEVEEEEEEEETGRESPDFRENDENVLVPDVIGNEIEIAPHTEENHIQIVELEVESVALSEDNLEDDMQVQVSDEEEPVEAEEFQQIDICENKNGSAKETKELLAFPCISCENSYHTEHGLKVHIRNVHDPNKPHTKTKKRKPPNKCNECGVICRTSRDLTAHILKHTGIFCDICGRSFAQTAHLTRHKIRHSGIKNFVCEQCSKAFFTAKELKAHMICHSSVMPVICEICGKGCRNESVLNAHMRRHTGERPAKCDVCGKCFFSWHDLKVHAVAHTDDRPFECDICGSTFQRKKALRVHKLRHSDNRKHVCKVCTKGFAQSSGLKAHMRTHDAANIIIATNKGETFEEVVNMDIYSGGDYISDSE